MDELPGKSTMATHGARLDITANGFWIGRFESTFMDVRIFNPHAPSNRVNLHWKVLQETWIVRKRVYSQQVRKIKHSSFTPLVLSASGGLTSEPTTFYKRLPSLLAEKWVQPYSLTMNWLRCIISFSLLRSAIQWIRGSRSSRGHAVSSAIDLVMTEAKL